MCVKSKKYNTLSGTTRPQDQRLGEKSFFGKGYFNAKGVKIPVAVSVFPDELYPAPRSWAEQAYPNLIHYNRLPKGGHFAAWEKPEFLTQELRTAFSSLR